MDEFKEGDLVEAVKGETVVRGRLVEPLKSADDFWVGDSTKLLSGLRYCGFAVSLVERAQPELPTEPGIYLDGRGNVAQLTADTTDYEERWFNEYGQYMTHTEVRERAPFTRLEPVADTARKVLDRVRGLFGEGALMLNEVDDIAEEFGVAE